MKQLEKRKVLIRLRDFKNALREQEIVARDHGYSWDQAQWTRHYERVRTLKDLIAQESRKLPLY